MIAELGRRGITVPSLAARAGIDPELLQMSLDCRRDLTVTELAAVAHALGVSPASLVPALPADDPA